MKNACLVVHPLPSREQKDNVAHKDTPVLAENTPGCAPQPCILRKQQMTAWRSLAACITAPQGEYLPNYNTHDE